MIRRIKKAASKDTLITIIKFIAVIFAVYLFLVSIGLISAAFKGFGKGFAENLLKTTSNPFIALFIGILATSIIQSSSTTTSLVVGMVSSGIIPISGAIPIIMGANIGTTVTNMMVSLGHITHKEEFRRAIAGAAIHDFFNIMVVSILFPLELMTGFLEKSSVYLSQQFLSYGGITFTSPLQAITKPVVKGITDFFVNGLNVSQALGYTCVLIFASILTFFTLFMIVKLMKSIAMAKTENIFNQIIGKNALLAVFGGMIITTIIQSSSITTSLLVPMIGAGILSLEAAYPVTIGANIGTTTTAILASFATGNPAAIAIGFAHFLFNFIGAIIFFPIRFLRNIPIKLAKMLGELAYKKRVYAVLYMLCIFFIVPIILITISKLF
ncbi:MAG: Na/Pi symporter [Elusimicrobia bacterium]|nr:Na/Pi symporter [Elusimicrobiota bacterium]